MKTKMTKLIWQLSILALLAPAQAWAQRAPDPASAKLLASVPEGDKEAIRKRWWARPDRCRSGEAWDKANGAGAEPAKSAAHIAGLEDAGLDARKATHDRVFVRSGDGRLTAGMSPDEHLARQLCGYEVEGIDEHPDLYNMQFLENDSRTALGAAILSGKADEAHTALYKAALTYLCFAGSSWKMDQGYLAYRYCSEALGQPPETADVEKALEQLFPKRDFERANLLYQLKRGLEASGPVKQAFEAMELKYPRMKAVFRDSADQARQRIAERRERYADYFRVLDPITQAIFEDPQGKPAPDCEQTLLGLRAKLAQEVPPHDEEGVRTLRVGHPVGYQITEALAHCYLGLGKKAKASLEAEALRLANRRLTLDEEMFYSRYEALNAAEQELGTGEKMLMAIPNYAHRFESPVPLTVLRTPHFKEMIGGGIESRGMSREKPAVVAAIKKVAEGVQLTFKKFSTTTKYRDDECKSTNKIARFDIEGNRVVPVYEKICHPVGPVKSYTTTYQEKPMVIPASDASLVKEGMQVAVLVNVHDTNDTALESLFWPKTGIKEAMVLQGVPLRKEK